MEKFDCPYGLSGLNKSVNLSEMICLYACSGDRSNSKNLEENCVKCSAQIDRAVDVFEKSREERKY